MCHSICGDDNDAKDANEEAVRGATCREAAAAAAAPAGRGSYLCAFAVHRLMLPLTSRKKAESHALLLDLSECEPPLSADSIAPGSCRSAVSRAFLDR